ncbi:MAG: transposase [Ktedonobacterales bacterium]|nr:transposase [Ktedonobacterales bacterium]
MAWKAAHPTADAGARRAAATRFATALRAVYAPYVESMTPQRVLSARMAKHLHELFVFVIEVAVPPDNNQAERDLRHLVTSGNAAQGAPGGGTRSAAGSDAKMTLASVFGTWRKQGESPYTACRALFVSPNLNSYVRRFRGPVLWYACGRPLGSMRETRVAHRCHPEMIVFMRTWYYAPACSCARRVRLRAIPQR